MELAPGQFNLLATKKDLKKTDDKVDKLDKRVDKLDKRVDKLDDKVDKLDDKVDKLDKRVDTIDNKLDKLTICVIKNTEDIEDIKARMATKEDINKVLTAVDGIAKRFDDHNIEHIANQAAHDRFEERITKIEKLHVKSA